MEIVVHNKNWITGLSIPDEETLLSGMKKWVLEQEYKKIHLK